MSEVSTNAVIKMSEMAADAVIKISEMAADAVKKNQKCRQMQCENVRSGGQMQ